MIIASIASVNALSLSLFILMILPADPGITQFLSIIIIFTRYNSQPLRTEEKTAL